MEEDATQAKMDAMMAYYRMISPALMPQPQAPTPENRRKQMRVVAGTRVKELEGAPAPSARIEGG